MTLRIVPDDEIDDSLAANLEPPRGRRLATGQTHWAIVERPGPAPTATASPTSNRCASPPLGCGEDGVGLLHATGNDPRRRVCGVCAGRINRDRIGWAQAAEPEQKGPRR